MGFIVRIFSRVNLEPLQRLKTAMRTYIAPLSRSQFLHELVRMMAREWKLREHSWNALMAYYLMDKYLIFNVLIQFYSFTMLLTVFSTVLLSVRFTSFCCLFPHMCM
jgi:hypothetical protein